jgi:excisionase family DNA binding protein
VSQNAKTVEHPLPLAVSVQEAARLIGASPGLLRKHIKAGSIRTFRIGARVLVSRRELERLVQGEEMNAAPVR